MRLHHLRITAFGPFADTVDVDFDALFDSSVFLLCGDTGAGKSTVLDAVCFALYGEVPGERGAARQLRSQHAAPGVAPEVVLEAQVSGRRWRFTRSPAWQRPKKRGEGLTTEQARVLVEERVGEEWITRCTRLDEAGHLLTDLLSMTLDQFSQVALLPQGAFDTFLRASSEDRQRVLTQLFRTRRFEDVEKWLVEQRTRLRRESEKHRDTVTALLHRLSENAETTVPVAATDGSLDRAVEEGGLRTWVDQLLEGLRQRGRTAGTDLASAVAARDLTEADLASGRRTAELRARHARAADGAARLAAQADRLADGASRLAADARAEAVCALAEHADRQRQQAERAADRATRAVGAVTADLGLGEPLLDADELGERARRATARAAVARDFAPRARELDTATRGLATLDELVDGCLRERETLLARVQEAPEQLARSAERLAGVGERAARRPAALAAAERLEQQAAGLARMARIEADLVRARARRDEQERVRLDLRSAQQDLRELRLAGMAGELAAAVAVGADCPVCGSPEHPALATRSPGAPTEDDERALQVLVDDAAITLLTCEEAVHADQARLLAVREQLGGASSETVGDALPRARAALADTDAAAAELQEVQADHDDLDRAQRRDAAALGDTEVRLGAARERRAALQEQTARLSGELAAIVQEASPDGSAFGEVGEVSVADLARTNEHTARLLQAARDALLDQRREEQAVAQARASARDAALERGFAGVEQAVVAVLDPRQRESLRAEALRWQQVGVEVEAAFADPEVQRAATTPAPDLAALQDRCALAARAHEHVLGAERQVARQVARVEQRAAELAVALDAWAPVRAEHERVRAISELAEGRGSDNTRQMRLSAYVLAARLGQVVAAANERLVRMTDDRFLLEHTAQRGVGERRGGLSLLVRDQWTDQLRDPVTLSGGETFVVSLALALGLADVVSAEAGGARIDTLFVDEGFGSLDADTLELVMDTLDDLRDGGRVVGLVSHVAELRTRVPTQLLVRKTRTGSTLEQVVAGG